MIPFPRFPFFLFVFITTFFGESIQASGPGKEGAFGGRRVLIIGIDGCRRDVLRQVIDEGTVPQIAKLASTGLAYWNMEAGGPPIGPKNQPTISGPGWSTLLTGVFTDKHLVKGNGEKFASGNFSAYPHFFQRLRAAYPEAWLGSVVGKTWPEVNDILLARSGEGIVNLATTVPSETIMEDGVKRVLDDANVTREAVRCLSEENPDVLFLHYLDVDHSGHQFGFSAEVPQYLATIRRLDQHLGEVFAAVEARPRHEEESWLIAVVTDHGGTGKSHGGQSAEERHIFALFDGPGIAGKSVEEGRSFQSLLAPAVFAFLGAPVDSAWAWEDVAPREVPTP